MVRAAFHRALHRLRADAVNYVANGLSLGPLDQATAPTLWQWLVRSGLAHRIVWMVPEDTVTGGWRTNTDTGEDVTRNFDDRLRLADRLIEVQGSARIGGGAWLWPVTDGDDWSKPLTEGPHEVNNIVVIAREEGTALTWNSDPATLDFGRPSSLQVNIARGGAPLSAQIHASRLIYIPGSRAAVNQDSAGGIGLGVYGPDETYDVSTLGLYLASITDLERAWSSSGSLIARLSVWWIRLTAGHVAGTAEDDVADELEARLQLLQSSVGTRSLVPLLNEDEMGWAGPSVAGVRDLVTALSERVSAVEGISLAQLFGTPPGGLSTDDASGRRNYHALIGRERVGKLTPALLRLYEIVEGPQPDRRIVWPEVDVPSPREVADISLVYAQRDAILVSQVGSVTPDEVRARFAGGEETPLPILDPANDEIVTEPEEPAPPTIVAPPAPEVGGLIESEGEAEAAAVDEEL